MINNILSDASWPSMESLAAPSDGVQKRFQDHPYPGVAIDTPVFRYPSDHYRYDVKQAFYRRDGVLPNWAPRILDVGCGTGFKTLALSRANPGSSVLGVDFSEAAIDIARQRARALGHTSVEFRVTSIQDLSTLGDEFDYVNCDDVLYLTENPAAALQRLSARVSSRGVIRVNVHNAEQRRRYLRAQHALGLLGAHSMPTSDAIALTRRLYRALRQDLALRTETWSRSFEEKDDLILANHLLLGDKAFGIDDVFSLVQAAGLSFIDMVDRVSWNPTWLFRPEDDECSKEMLGRVQSLSRLDQLRFVALVHGGNRLFDFWCARPGVATDRPNLSRWELTRQKAAVAQLHSALLRPEVLDDARLTMSMESPWSIARFVSGIEKTIGLSVKMTDLVLILGTGSASIEQINREWVRRYPYDAPNNRHHSESSAFQEVLRNVCWLEELGVVFVLEPTDALAPKESIRALRN